MKNFVLGFLAAAGLFAIGMFAGHDPVIAQAFFGPATIGQPTTANHCLKVATTGGSSIIDAGAACGTGTAPSPANPTATAGASPVNGSASTYMRSDGAPALPIGTSGAAIPLLNGNNTWSGTVKMSTLPTSDPHAAGQLWNNAGALQVSAG